MCNIASPSTYLLDRKLLPPFIGPFSLGGFMIGCTTSSMFFGWQIGISFGWGNMAVALVLSTIMYSILLLSVSEMCTALPFTSGLSTFAQAAFNPQMFAFSGALHALSFTIFPAILLLSLCDTLCVIFLRIPVEFNDLSILLYWLPFPVLTILLHIRPRILFRVILVLSIYCSMLIATYIVIAVFSKPLRMNDNSFVVESQVPNGFSGISLTGIFHAFPFACSFYIGVESFPSTSEEAKKIFRTAPKVAKCCLTLLIIFSMGLLATFPHQSREDGVNSINPGGFNNASNASPSLSSSQSGSGVDQSPKIIQSKYFLLDNAISLICSRFTPIPKWCVTNDNNAIHRNHLVTVLITLTVFPPVFLSFITATYVSARHIYFMSRSGILPAFLSRTHSGAPIFATCTSQVLAVTDIGLIYLLNKIPFLLAPTVSPNATVLSTEKPDQSAPTVDLNVVHSRFRSQTSFMLVLAYFWVSSLTYIVKLGTYIALCVRVPNLPRPFVSPFGVIGACVGIVISLGFGVIGPFLFKPFFYGSLLALGFVLGVMGALYWVFVVKNRVANNPEKIFIRHQLKQLWGRSWSVQRIPYQIRGHQANGIHNRNLCSTTAPLNSVGIPNPISVRLAAFRNRPSQWQSYSTPMCSTFVIANTEGLTEHNGEV